MVNKNTLPANGQLVENRHRVGEAIPASIDPKVLLLQDGEQERRTNDAVPAVSALWDQSSYRKAVALFLG
jgi:hypothetical protein